MKKNKILGIAIAAMISMSSIVPAFAADYYFTGSNNNYNSKVKLSNQATKKYGKLTSKRAAKLGVDITGLTNEQAKEKNTSRQKQQNLGVDITGLSKEDAKAKIKAAIEAKNLAETY